MKLRPERKLEYLPPADLKPAPDNPRRHNADQIRKIANCMKKFGAVAPLIVDRNGQLIVGHARREAAIQAGIARVPVIRADDLTEAEARGYMLADNKLTEGSSWDEQLLAAHLKALSQMALDFEIEDVGFAVAEMDALTLDLDGSASQDKADTFAVGPGPAVSQVGDLWLLGDHRLVCGSALDPATYATLMGKDKAAAVFTDPPYNVPIGGNVSGNGAVVHREFVQATGEMSRQEFTDFLAAALTHSRAATTQGGLIYAFMDHRHLEEILAGAATAGLERINLCIWVKSNGGMGSFYRSRHELCFVFQNPGAAYRNNVQLGRFKRNRTNVWEYAGANAFPRKGEKDMLAMHPTIKPVALVADAILDSTRQGDIVLDPFLGSGSTVLATERTKRRGYGIELDPLYVDTAIQRWQRLTKRAATLSTGKTFAEVREERKNA
jgi:DNA modification methylase